MSDTVPYYDEARSAAQGTVAQSDEMRAQRAALIDLMAPRAGERILDVGTGNGVLLEALAPLVGAGGALVGVDPAEAMVAHAAATCPWATVLAGDATSLPVEDDAFDVVTASQVLCFVDDVDAALAEMARVLRPGGRAVVLDTDWDSLVWRCADGCLRERVVAELTSAYASAHVPATLSRRFAAAGLRVDERRVHPIVNWRLDPASYSGQLAGFLPGEPGDGDSLAARWSDELAASDARGEYFFSLNRYLFRASAS